MRCFFTPPPPRTVPSFPISVGVSVVYAASSSVELHSPSARNNMNTSNSSKLLMMYLASKPIPGSQRSQKRTGNPANFERTGRLEKQLVLVVKRWHRPKHSKQSNHVVALRSFQSLFPMPWHCLFWKWMFHFMPFSCLTFYFGPHWKESAQ